MATDTIPVIHTSDRTTFKRCRQQWQFSSPLRMNLQPTSTGPDALWFGSGIHQSLAAHYSPSTARDINLALSEWDIYCKERAEQNQDLDDATWDLGKGMLEYYGKWAAKNDSTYFEEVIWVEREMTMPLHLKTDRHDYVKYSFKCDGLVKDKHGRFWILEHKTAKSFASSYDYLANDDQVGTYLLMVQKELGHPIEGVIYTILKKKVPRKLDILKNGNLSQDKRQDTNYDIAFEQIVEKYDLLPGDKIPPQYKEFLDFLFEKPNNFIYREAVRRNQEEIRNLGESLKMEIRDMVNDPTIYRSTSPWNCGQCAFFTPCLQKWEGSDYATTLRNLYQPREEVNVPH